MTLLGLSSWPVHVQDGQYPVFSTASGGKVKCDETVSNNLNLFKILFQTVMC